jgi:hypothetical protein
VKRISRAPDKTEELLEASAAARLADFDGALACSSAGTLVAHAPSSKRCAIPFIAMRSIRRFHFKPTEKMFEVGDDLYLTMPNDSRFASVQVTLKGGTKSSVQKIVREK